MKKYRHIILGGVFAIRDERYFVILEEPTVPQWLFLREWWFKTTKLSSEDFEYFEEITLQ